MRVKLILPLPISINDLYINQYVWDVKARKMVPSGKRILSKDGERVKQEIINSATEQMSKFEWDYEYTKTHYLYMDSYIFFNRKGRDDNNIYKLNNDALEKIVYDNDSRVLTRTQRILYDKKNPRVELEFYPVEFVGIFDNEDESEAFINKCMTCKRYKRNCSILNAALDGFIQDDINEDKICNTYSPTKK